MPGKGAVQCKQKKRQEERKQKLQDEEGVLPANKAFKLPTLGELGSFTGDGSNVEVRADVPPIDELPPEDQARANKLDRLDA